MRKVCRPTPRQLKSETTIIERVEEEVMRQAEIERNTFETKIKLSLNLDAQEPVDIQTGVGFFDHMLTLFARHGRMSLVVTAMTTEVPSSKLCIGCGGCSATCTAGNLTEFNIRKLQMLVKRGETKEVGEHLQKCMLCGKCLLVCPRGVDTRRMILSMLKYTNSL